jgi:hypothetical protein
LKTRFGNQKLEIKVKIVVAYAFELQTIDVGL